MGLMTGFGDIIDDVRLGIGGGIVLWKIFVVKKTK
jgi:hypothetical protein